MASSLAHKGNQNPITTGSESSLEGRDLFAMYDFAWQAGNGIHAMPQIIVGDTSRTKYELPTLPAFQSSKKKARRVCGD
jgi:hypothetical protein